MENEIFYWQGQSVETLIGKTVAIPIEKIVPDERNLRETFDEKELIALGENIKEIGQMDAIKVFPKTEKNGKWVGIFDLHDGERRWRAAKLTGIKYLRAEIENKPFEEDLIFKRIARVLQTESLKPEEKVLAVEKTFGDLGILDKPEEWEKYRDKLGASKERFAEITRVIQLPSKLRDLMFSNLMSYSIAQAVGRLPRNRQEDAAKFVLTNKLYGRYVVTEFIPYLIENPEASYAQAFEHTKVGGWRMFTKKPSKSELTPDYEKIIDEFLNSCVLWERAWDKLVASKILHEIKGKTLSPYRLKDSLSRVIELAEQLLIEIYDSGGGVVKISAKKTKLLGTEPSKKVK
jgi:ParB/RepB/Spo0J family partition protein